MVLGQVWSMFSDLVGSFGPSLAQAPDDGPLHLAETPTHPGAATPTTRWNRNRIAIVDALWGEGFTFPNGEQETLHLAKPLALSKASSLLLVGAGTGGAPCCITAQLGAWVTGFEADPELALVATERSTRSGLGKRAEIRFWDPMEANFLRRNYHHALTLEALRGEPSGPLLAGLFQALRPGGQLVMVDLVAEQPLDPRDAEVVAWCRLEGRPPVVPSQRAINGALGRLGFDVRVTEDISLRHMQQALHGWHNMIRGMHSKKPAPAMAMVVVREAELWLRRLSLMRAHLIRLMRWHAIRSDTAG
jgi:SAM-dependent methyltransferase